MSESAADSQPTAAPEQARPSKRTAEALEGNDTDRDSGPTSMEDGASTVVDTASEPAAKRRAVERSEMSSLTETTAKPRDEAGPAVAAPVASAAAVRTRPPAPPGTVLAMFEDLREKQFRDMLEPKGWTFVRIEEAVRMGRGGKKVDLIVVDGNHNADKRLYNLRCGSKSRIDANVITNKIELHLLLRECAPELIPQCWIVTKQGLGGAQVEDGVPHIWRPEGGWKGDGVMVITSQEQLLKAQDSLRPKYARGRVPRAVLSRYLENPLILDDRKLNVRLYYVLVVEGQGDQKRTRAALLREGMIGVAPKPYKNGNWEDKDVHDSRTLKIKDYRFPRDYPGGAEAANIFFDRAANILTTVSRHTERSVKAYDESDNAFEMLGCDFMVDADTGRVWLIEINFKPGHQQLVSHEQDSLSMVVLGGIYEYVLGYPPLGDSPCYKEVWPVGHPQ